MSRMQSVSRFIFGPTPEERIQEVRRRLRAEDRALDREIRQIDQAVSKAKNEVRMLAKKGDTKSARILAREVVRSQKQKNRLALSKVQLQSIGYQLQSQKSNQTVASKLKQSQGIMKESNQLIKLPQFSKVMREVNAELMKAGIIEEMMDDTLDSGALGEDEDEMEAEADGEVDKVLFEITDGKLGQAGKAGSALPELTQPAAAEANDDDTREREDMERMQEALDGLLRG